MADLYVAEDRYGNELSLAWAGADEQLRLSLSLPLDAGENYGVDYWLTPDQARELGTLLVDLVKEGAAEGTWA